MQYVQRSDELKTMLSDSREKTVFFPSNAALPRRLRFDLETVKRVEDILFALTFPGRETEVRFWGQRRTSGIPLKRELLSIEENGTITPFWDIEDDLDKIGFRFRYRDKDGEHSSIFKVTKWDIPAANGVIHVIGNFPEINF